MDDAAKGGVSQEERARYIGLWERAEREQQLEMLEEQRRALLKEIHQKEEQQDHPDYLRHETR